MAKKEDRFKVIYKKIEHSDDTPPGRQLQLSARLLYVMWRRLIFYSPVTASG